MKLNVTETTECPPDWRWIGQDDYAARFERTDGAYVLRSRDEYHANPMNPRHRGWIAFIGVTVDDENGTALCYRRRDSVFRMQRRWKTPQAAMKAVGREHPVVPKK